MGSRLDAIHRGYIIELKNYDWSKYSSYGGLINKFLEQANKYLSFVGSLIKDEHIKGVVFLFSSRPPDDIVKALEGVGIIVRWLQ